MKLTHYYIHCRFLKFSGDCSFSDHKKGNIAIVDQKNMPLLQHSEFLEENFDESGFKNTDVSMSNGKLCQNEHSWPIIVDDPNESIQFSDALSNRSFHPNSTAEISIISID